MWGGMVVFVWSVEERLSTGVIWLMKYIFLQYVFSFYAMLYERAVLKPLSIGLAPVICLCDIKIYIHA